MAMMMAEQKGTSPDDAMVGGVPFPV